MPIYAYRCKECDHHFEARQRFSDSPLTDCPVCSGSVRRVISPVGIVFKGSGFYVTDNRNGRSNGAVTGGSKKSEGEASPVSTDADQKKGGTEKATTPPVSDSGETKSAQASSSA
jgi:putative FmdB family regulatory protein